MRVSFSTLVAAAAVAAVPAGATADGMDDMAAYPDLAHAAPAQVTQARQLWHGTLSAAPHHFSSWTAAWRAGYTSLGLRPRHPVIYHLRSGAYERDGAALDPRRPESLVYWLPRRGSPVLVGFMYRVPANRRWRGRRAGRSAPACCSRSFSAERPVCPTSGRKGSSLWPSRASSTRRCSSPCGSSRTSV